jgi:hypothetical protein
MKNKDFAHHRNPGVCRGSILRWGISIATIAVLVLNAPRQLQAQTACDTNKWFQPPARATNVFYGWNQGAWYERYQTADDWVCTNAAPVTRIRWWGSFIGWEQSQHPTVVPPVLPAGWVIHIWTDVPAGHLVIRVR